MRILLVEDEPRMAAALRAGLEVKHGMVMDHVTTLADADMVAGNPGYDAILLDRQLPDGDGIQLVPRLRGRGVTLPIIVITAKGEVPDRIAGLEIGADDYLAKPFVFDELLARLRAVMRRPGDIRPSRIVVGRLVFDLGARDMLVGDKPLELTRREFLVLECLIRRGGRMVSRTALMEAVFGFDDEIQSNALDTHVSRLRKKLNDAGAGVEIHPIRGVGYLMKRAS